MSAPASPLPTPQIPAHFILHSRNRGWENFVHGHFTHPATKSLKTSKFLMSFSERIKLNKQTHWEKEVFNHAVVWLLLHSPCPSSRSMTPKGTSLGLKGSELELTGSPGGVPVPPLSFGCGTDATEAAEPFLVTWKHSSFCAPGPPACPLPLPAVPVEPPGGHSWLSHLGTCGQMCQLITLETHLGCLLNRAKFVTFLFLKLFSLQLHEHLLCVQAQPENLGSTASPSPARAPPRTETLLLLPG